MNYNLAHWRPNNWSDQFTVLNFDHIPRRMPAVGEGI